MRLIHKIFAVILEEINGYSKEEAEKLAAENEGSEAYTRINSLLSENGIEDEDSDYMLNVPKIKYEIDLILDDLNTSPGLIIEGSAAIQFFELADGREAQLSVSITTEEDHFEEIAED